MTTLQALDIVPGVHLAVNVESNTISRLTYPTEVEIVWVENGHVHYRIQGCVKQTPMDRFLEIANKPAKY